MTFFIKWKGQDEKERSILYDQEENFFRFSGYAKDWADLMTHDLRDVHAEYCSIWDELGIEEAETD